MFKKAISIAILTIVITTTVNASSDTGTYKGNPIVKLVVNDNTVNGEVPAINLDGTTMVPIRVVAENLGANVNWNSETKTAIIAIQDKGEDTSKDSTTGKDTSTSTNIYHDFLISLDYLVRDAENIQQRLLMISELNKTVSDYKRIGSELEKIQEVLIPQQLKRIVDFQVYLEDLNSKGSLSKDQYTALNTQLFSYYDAIKKYDVAVTSFAKYREGQDTTSMRNFLIYLYDGFNMVCDTGTFISKELENN